MVEKFSCPIVTFVLHSLTFEQCEGYQKETWPPQAHPCQDQRTTATMFFQTHCFVFPTSFVELQLNNTKFCLFEHLSRHVCPLLLTLYDILRGKYSRLFPIIFISVAPHKRNLSENCQIVCVKQRLAKAKDSLSQYSWVVWYCVKYIGVRY